MSTRPRTALPLLLLPLAACRSTEAPPPPTPQALVAELEPGAREFVGYGGYRRELSATTPGARSWFDQGLQMVYGFNHDAGVRCFAAAAAADPDCAMAWWGIAYGYGIDVNNPAVEPHESAAAYAASLEAQRCAPAASEVERALIEAVALRAVHPLPEDRVPLDEAYAEAMGRAWTRFPTDPDVGALYAEALMNLQPWDYWTAEGEPVERAFSVEEAGGRRRPTPQAEGSVSCRDRAHHRAGGQRAGARGRGQGEPAHAQRSRRRANVALRSVSRVESSGRLRGASPSPGGFG